jgi:Asp/Glu/hydantoin racemase
LPKKLALIHTSPSLTPMFQELCVKLLPGVAIFHMVDESLIKNTIAAGHLEKLTTRRVMMMVESARLAGADAVLVTCSSIGEAVTMAARVFDFPVVRVDDAMAEKAVTMGPRIGVLATLRTTLEPTTTLVRSKTGDTGVTVIDHLCEGAFEAVMAGDTAKHDAMVSAALLEIQTRVDVVVLAQASMTRVLGTMEPGALKVPVLSSPELAVRRVADLMQAQG